jgi:formylglycine-generating enzyme required for sulfatase activity/energy-coupling factor transporter ATP-binding protein EcfA2
MAFDIQEWKEKIKQRLEGWQERMRESGISSIYAFLTSMTFWPVIEAARMGDYSGFSALGILLAGVGTNLLANNIQTWKDEIDGAQKINIEIEHNPQIVQEADEALKQFEIIQLAEQALPEKDRQWFQQQIKKELQELGNYTKFSAKLNGSGAIAQGNGAKAVGKGGTMIERGAIVNSNVNIVQNDKRTDALSLEQAYLNRLFVDCGKVFLSGVDPAVAGQADTCLQLNAIYTALYTETPEREETPDKAMLQRERQKQSALEQLNKTKRLVLLGDPGSGKSTFVNFIALCLAGEQLRSANINLSLLRAPLPPEPEQREEKKQQIQPWDHEALLPMRIILRDFAARGLPSPGKKATAGNLWEFIAAELKTATLEEYTDALHQKLLKEGGLILLDGLDEVQEADKRRQQIKEAVEDFAGTFGKCRILVTSRVYAYQKQDWRLQGFAETTLAPFTRGQIIRFVEQWYTHIGSLRAWNANDIKGRAEILKNAIFKSANLLNLAERPLILTLMASLHAWRGGQLPEKREELYHDVVNLLLDQWEGQKTVRKRDGSIEVMQQSLAEWLKVDRKKVRAFLNEIAFQVHSQQDVLEGTADIKEADLIASLIHISENPEVNPAQLIEYLQKRAGLLIPRGGGVYAFPHRTFQEYLAACHLTDDDFPDKIAELARKSPDKWREVTLLAGAKSSRGTTSNIWQLAEALCYKTPDGAQDLEDLWGAHLAGLALAETANLTHVSERNKEKLRRVQDCLVHILETPNLSPVERAVAGNPLAILGDPRKEVMTLEDMQFCLVPKGPFIMGSNENDREKPEHQNDELSYDYWISRFPVTNAQYKIFVEEGGYQYKAWWPEAIKEEFWKAGKFKGRYDDEYRDRPYHVGSPFNLDNHPVVGVSWYEALAFARWLTARWQQEDYLPDGMKVGLPSEAEWEKAARGGKELHEIKPAKISELKAFSPKMKSVKNPLPERRLPWGDEEQANRGNFAETQITATSAAGCFPQGASPYGCEEMSGNVWEWTRSLYMDYPYVPGDGREKSDAPSDKGRVLRGGSYLYPIVDARCSFRYWYYPYLWFRSFGFRLVLSLFNSDL